MIQNKNEENNIIFLFSSLQMLNLSIQLQSINLSKDIISDIDRIRVSITTLPDQQKQAQSMDVYEMNSIQPTFKIQVNDKTEKIVIVFRKKGIFGSDHIIASTVIKTQDIHIFKELISSEHQKITIFEPIQNKNNNKSIPNKNRRIVGTTEVEFTLTEEFRHQKCNTCAFSQIDPLMYNQSKGLKDFVFQDPILN